MAKLNYLKFWPAWLCWAKEPVSLLCFEYPTEISWLVAFSLARKVDFRESDRCREVVIFNWGLKWLRPDPNGGATKFSLMLETKMEKSKNIGMFEVIMWLEKRLDMEWMKVCQFAYQGFVSENMGCGILDKLAHYFFTSF